MSRTLNTQPSKHVARSHGMALAMVLIALAAAGILAVGFLASQATGITIGQNVSSHERARLIAESALDVAIARMQADPQWGDSVAADGTWVTAQAWAGGEYDLTVIDDSGGFTNEPGKDVTLTALSRFNGVTHQVHAQITPSVASNRALLLIADNPDSLDPQDAAKQTIFQEWGYDVTVMDPNSNESELQAAAAEVDVIYISEVISSASLNNKLVGVPVGVVCEEEALVDEYQISDDADTADYDSIYITDNTHYITSPLEMGNLVIASADTEMIYFRDDPVDHATVLSRRGPGGEPTLVAIEVGTTLLNDTRAMARYVWLPWGSNDFDFNLINEAGLTILKRSLEWASVQPTGLPEILHYDFGTQSGDTVMDRIGGANLKFYPNDGEINWTYDEHGQGVTFNQGSDGNAIIRSSSDVVGQALKNTLKASNAVTVQVYFRQSGGDSDARVFSFSSGTNMHSRNFTIIGDPNGGSFRNQTRLRTNQGTTDSGHSQAWEADQPTVFAFTYDQAAGDDMKTYVNGELIYTDTSSKAGFENWEDRHLMLGNEQSLNRAFEGTIYDVKVWNRALSQAELMDNAETLLSQTAEDGAQLVALYEFNEPVGVVPALIGHWTFNTLTASKESNGLQIAADDVITLPMNSLIDSYSSIYGAYSSDTAQSNAQIATNSTSNNKVKLYKGTTYKGDVMVGPGADPEDVVKVYSNASLTGEAVNLDQRVDVSDPADPSGEFPPSEGDREDSKDDDITIGEDDTETMLTYDDWDISKSTITIRGDVQIDVLDDFTIDKSDMILAPDASLRLYVGGIARIYKSNINADSTRTHDLTLINYGNGHDQDFRIYKGSVIAGAFRSADDVEIESGAVIYGTIFAEDDLKALNGVSGSGVTIHCDTTLGLAGDSFADETGQSTGTAHGGVAKKEGKFSYAASFDGKDDYVEVSHDDIYLLDVGAVSFWFYANDTSGTQGLVTKDSTNYDDGGHFRVYLDGATVKARIQSSGASYHLSAGTSVSAYNWHHVTVGFGPGGFRMYLNGERVASDDYSGGLGISSGGSGNREPWVFGADTVSSDDQSSDGWSDPFHGRIDDVRIYNQNLNDDQVAALLAGNDPAAGVGQVVKDTSGYGDPLNMIIQDIEHVTWLEGTGLHIHTPTVIASPDAATKLHAALTATGEMTLQAIFTPDALTLDNAAPDRIFTMSGGTSSRNFTLGQNEGKYTFDLRTDSTGNSNGEPGAEQAGLSTTEQHHVIITYDGEYLKLYRNGELEKTVDYTGDLDSWYDGFKLLIGDEVSGGRDWLGTLYRIAIYDKGLTPNQVGNVFNGDPPGDPEVLPDEFAVRWQEHR